MPFVTVEGIDGSGKGTLIDKLQDELDGAVFTREPSPHWTGEQTRRAIDEDETHPMTDFHFFVGDRAYHIKHTIWPALNDGKLVISDRYADSTRVYQEEALSDLVDDPLEYINNYITGDWHPEPDLTILIDVPAEVAVERTTQGDKYEAPEFLKSVRDNYLSLWARHPRIHLIDGEQTPETVYEQVIELLKVHGFV